LVFFISNLGEGVIGLDKQQQMITLFIQGLYNQQHEAESIDNKIDAAKVMLDDILKRFENIREWVRDLEAGGDIFKSHAMAYPGGRGSSVEYNIISVIECSRIKDSVESSITLLDDDLYELLVKKYWDRIRIRDLARSYKLPEISLRKRLDDMQLFIINDLERREVTYQNLYWFWDKFFGSRQEKAG
jgi:hypothetical protein